MTTDSNQQRRWDQKHMEQRMQLFLPKAQWPTFSMEFRSRATLHMRWPMLPALSHTPTARANQLPPQLPSLATLDTSSATSWCSCWAQCHLSCICSLSETTHTRSGISKPYNSALLLIYALLLLIITMGHQHGTGKNNASELFQMYLILASPKHAYLYVTLYLPGF